jgi:AbrB family looped-hinge helix DNA binding protein
MFGGTPSTARYVIASIAKPGLPSKQKPPSSTSRSYLVDSCQSVSNIELFGRRFVMALAKINAHYQVTIPKSVRQKAKVKKGSYVKVDYRAGTIFIRPISRIEEKQELRSLRQAAEKKFADVWKDEDDAVWESYL